MDFPALKIGFFSALENLFKNGAVLGLQLASNVFRTTVWVGFAIPANMMKSLIDQIAEFGEVRRGLLGILGSDIDAGLAEAMNAEVNIGAFVSEVQPDSAAEKGGHAAIYIRSYR